MNMARGSGNAGGASRRTGTSRHRAFLVCALGAAAAMPGCATKKDVRTLQAAITDLQVHQDSVLRNIQRQQRAMLDTLHSSMAISLDTRGQTSHRFEELNGLLESTKQLNGQILEVTRQLFARIDALEAKLQQLQPTSAPPPVQSAPSGSTGMSAAQMFQKGLSYMSDGSYGSARATFGAVIRQFHDDPNAPESQFQIGEAYVAEQNYGSAYRAFEQVSQEWPPSPRASEALYRAGKVAEDRKDNTNARKYYNMVLQLYPRSDSAQLARKALTKIQK